MKIAFLIGSDSDSTRHFINTACQVPVVDCVAVLLDTAPVPLSRRRRNLKRNIRREGRSYTFYRALDALNDLLNKIASRIIPRHETNELLQKAFPQRSYTIWDLAKKYSFPILEVGNLNSSKAVAALRECEAELGVIVGTRILKRSTFSVPPQGCINVHEGKVPEYRGYPPGFWEIYEGAKIAGITIHFIDSGLDTGDIVGTSEVAIHKNETVSSLQTKLHWEGASLLAKCLTEIASGIAKRTPQPKSKIKPRTNPTRKQRLELIRLRPKSFIEKNFIKEIIKTSVYLGFYYLGIYSFVRLVRRLFGISRGKIILYHRVNDYSSDVLTTDSSAFANHLLLFKKYYQVQSTSKIVQWLLKRDRINPGTVVIHFDDCYKEVYTEAARLLSAASLPATAFISSGFIDSDRSFEHDLGLYPFIFENMSSEEVRGLQNRGLEIGAHTVNHANLGTISAEQAREEIDANRASLENIIGQPVDFFSFPFGALADINEDSREIVRTAGFKALFSAHGGTVNKKTNPFDIPRIGASSEHRPLDLMMEIEGLSFTDLAGYLFFWKKAD